MKSVNKNITELLTLKIDSATKHKKEIFKALNVLLNGNYKKYDIESAIVVNDMIDLSDHAFQNLLAHINEKSDKRKLNGVYYTPNDVARYIICNSFINKFIPETMNPHNYDDGVELISRLSNLEELLYSTNAIDPTCGSGEFLVNVFELKHHVLINSAKVTDDAILRICQTIFGNDIDEESTDIAKIRMFFSVANYLESGESLIKLARILNKQFYNEDFICESHGIKKRFEIVIGNPPYVEYGKYKDKDKLSNGFGNVYADVIKNSLELLGGDGVLGFIIPISYVSTARMGRIREYVVQNTSRQCILSFADRPDCLFNGVHQKLNILICQKGQDEHKVYTSNYKHWYKSERPELLNGRSVIENPAVHKQFIPKVGNELELKIFKKIFTDKADNLFDMQEKESGEEIYLNMRGCFWIKAFSFNPGSNEYKQLRYSKNQRAFVYCILNSSLFWLYWTIMSDCWHITTKELKMFRLPTGKEIRKEYVKLGRALEDKLEQTKEYVGTRQVDYEYKHKYCKSVIDQIDDLLAKEYGLTKREVKYIKEFAHKYRMGGYDA